MSNLTIEQNIEDSTTTTDNLERLRKKLEIKDKISEQYYKEVIVHIENRNLPDPVGWIRIQNKMRELWESHLNCPLNGKSDFDLFINKLMCSDSNSLYKYMNFMYNEYPPGFGEMLSDSYKKSIPFDRTEIFLRCFNRHSHEKRKEDSDIKEGSDIPPKKETKYKIIKKYGYRKYNGHKQGNLSDINNLTKNLHQQLRIRYNLSKLDSLPPHCLICGDTSDDGNLIHALPINKYFCKFCFNVQSKM